MAVEILADSPVYPPSTVGPYRYADYLEQPDEPRCELLYGRFYLSPAPSLPHQVAALVLWRWLDDLACSTGGLALAAPVDIVLTDHSVVQPDLIYLAAERRTLGVDHIEGAPDLLVEVLSPRTVRRDRGEKLKLYAESGVREYWLVDPALRQIEFLLNRGGRFEVVLTLDGFYRPEILPGAVLDLRKLWDDVDARLGR
ncbi:MAG: Uma2 family endonuclease [Acidobacteriota bacterium]|nr:Uma2 family endonuclease [Acidobacteriota bacterium]